ncbi:hypothetical protein GCM10025782_30020 [Pedococcus ginsenosidimutans]|jgi:hypothetical protein|uniref:Uncharacterized protein n=1 Tax=Pedococcus ginsenosidimutans TaxID=490570 RepID=A0ABP8YL90_9MICO
MVSTSGSLGRAVVVALEVAGAPAVVDVGVAGVDGLAAELLGVPAGACDVEVAGAAAPPEQAAVSVTARPAAARGARARMGPESRSP